MYFAGEAYDCKLKNINKIFLLGNYQGDLDGAHLSGMRNAKAVSNCLKNNSCEYPNSVTDECASKDEKNLYSFL